MACIIDRQERARRIARCHRPLRPPTIRSQKCDTLKQLITALPVMLMVAQPTSRDFLFLFGLRLPSVGPRFAGNDHSAGRFMGIAEPYTLLPVNSDRPLHSTGELHCPPSPIYVRCCTCTHSRIEVTYYSAPCEYGRHDPPHPCGLRPPSP